MALIAVVDVFFDFVSDTLISIFAGCVSMASIIGLSYAGFYLVYKNIKYLWWVNICLRNSVECKKRFDLKFILFWEVIGYVYCIDKLDKGLI